MRKILAFLFIYLCSCINAFGIIIETDRFENIVKYAAPDALILLDIDDTLLIPAQTLGTDVWFLYRIQQNESKGFSKTEAFEKALGEWEAVRHLTQVQIVEEGTEKIIQELQAKPITVMGLTTQGLALATCTARQLGKLDIDLSKTAPSSEDHYFINGHGVLYRKGILFTSGTPKGKALFTLLDLIGYAPKRIVFINDKAKHLKDVEEEAELREVEFIGLRYSYSDQRINNFRPEIADIQWAFSSFDSLLSDQEAEELLKLPLEQPSHRF
jgi:hypothetical protein